MQEIQSPQPVTPAEMSCCRQNEIPVDRKLCKAAAEGKFEEFERYADSLDRLVNSKQDTILHIHLKSRGKRSAEFVKKVVDKCPHLLKQANENGDTPLHVAARSGHSEIVKLLIQLAGTRDLESRLDPIEEARKWIRMVNKDKDTALHEAVRWNNVGVVEEILGAEDLEHKYGVNSSGETPLYLAAHCWSVTSLRVMLEAYKHKPVAYQGPNGKTVLHAAVQFCYLNTALKVIENVESLVNEADENGWTPLHYAVCIRNSSSFVSKILEKDTSSAYMKDYARKRTPIHLAACLGNLDAMKIFMSMCPDCAELTDYRGWNACHFAAISKSFHAPKLILQDDSLAHLLTCKDINGYYPRDYSQALDFHSLRNYILDGESPDEEKMEEWKKDLGNGPNGKLVAGALVPNEKSPEDKRKEMEDKIIPELEKAKDSHLVAAILVATVTFAAAFTLPGGYVSDENKSNNLKLGSPILSRNVAFQAFMIANGIALVLSTSSVFIHYIMVMLGYKQKYHWLMRSAFWFIVFAMGAMVVAFVTGAYATLAPDSFWLAVLTCLIGLAFFLNVFYTVIRLITQNLEDWNFDTAPQYLCCDCCRPLCAIFFFFFALIFLPIYGLPLMIYQAWKRRQIRKHRQSELSSELRP